METPPSTLLSATPGTGPNQGIFREGARWEPQPVAAVAVGAAIRVGPAVLAALITLIAAVLVPRPHGFMWIAWWLGVIAVSQLVLRVATHFARQLRVLPPMLRLSLVFPDLAPSRFGLARQAANGAVLDETARTVAAEGLPKPLDEALQTSLLMVAALSRHDRTTRWHSERVLAFSELIAGQLDLDRISREKLRWGALLHDLGKLAVAPALLNTTTAPTDSDWALLRRHPLEAERMMAPLSRWLSDALKTATQHHERWDGKGYPRGLAAQQISLNARIVAVADAFAVMTAAPTYAEQRSLAAAREELSSQSGTQFDPTVVDALLALSDNRLAMAAGVRATVLGLPAVGPRLLALPNIPKLLVASVSSVLLVGVMASGFALSPLRWVAPLRGSSSNVDDLALTDANPPTDGALPGDSGVADVPVPAAGGGDFVTGNVAVTTSTTTTVPPPTTPPPTNPPTTLPPVTEAPTVPPTPTVAALVVAPTVVAVVAPSTVAVTTTIKVVVTTTTKVAVTTTTKPPKVTVTVAPSAPPTAVSPTAATTAAPTPTAPAVTAAPTVPPTTAAVVAPTAPPTTPAPKVFVPPPPPPTEPPPTTPPPE